MGCSTSTTSAGELTAKSGRTVSSRNKTAPADADGEATGAAAAAVVVAAASGGGGDNDDSTMTSGGRYPASQAFVIPLDNDDDGSSTTMASYEPTAPQPTPLFNKKPPKRIQELMEQAATSTDQPINLDEIEEKLNKAEMRRKEFLQLKIENIQKIAQQQQVTMSRLSERHPTDRDSATSAAAALELDLTATDIEKKALDDDSKQELLTSTLRSQALQ